MFFVPEVYSDVPLQILVLGKRLVTQVTHKGLVMASPVRPEGLELGETLATHVTHMRLVLAVDVRVFPQPLRTGESLGTDVADKVLGFRMCGKMLAQRGLFRKRFPTKIAQERFFVSGSVSPLVSSQCGCRFVCG
jgi:hypothetical protein